MNVFFSDEDRLEYLHLMQQQCERFGLHILSYCLMDNHVHFVAVPEREESLARAIGEAHRLYTRMVNFRDGVRGFLFQGRFFSCPLDEKYLLACIRYVERNPIRVVEGIKRAWDYPWSSARYRLGMTKSDPLVATRDPKAKYAGMIDDSLNWRQLLTKEEDEDDVKLLLKKTRTGRPCGNDPFVARLEDMTGRTLQPQKPGPKPAEGKTTNPSPRRSRGTGARKKRAGRKV